MSSTRSSRVTCRQSSFGKKSSDSESTSSRSISTPRFVSHKSHTTMRDMRRIVTRRTPGKASCWLESCRPFTICACSSEGRCVGKSHLEQARLATGSTAKLALSCRTSTGHENRRSGIRSGGLLHELIVVRGRIAPSAATIVEAGGKQLCESCERPRCGHAPEAPRSPCTGSRSR